MAIDDVRFTELEAVMHTLRVIATCKPDMSTELSDLVREIQRVKDNAERIVNGTIRLARAAKYHGDTMTSADSLLIVGTAPCVFCHYSGEGFFQSNTHASGCPWEHVGGLTERGVILMLAYGDIGDVG